MQNDRATELLERRRRFVVCRARVHDHRLVERGSQLELRREGLSLVFARCVVAVEVQPDLPDGDDLAVHRGGKFVERLAVGRLMRMDAGSDGHTGLAARNRERLAGRVEARSDRDHALDSRGTGTSDCA